MNCAIMGNLDGNLTKLAFDMGHVKRIIDVGAAEIVSCHERKELFLKVDDHVCRVEGAGNGNGGNLGEFFIVLDSWKAFSVKDFQILFNVTEFPDLLVSGTDSKGEKHFCSRYSSRNGNGEKGSDGNLAVKTGEYNPQDMENLKDMVFKLRSGEFYEALTTEFSGKIKEIARELIDFRQDLQRKIQPGIVLMAEKQIPEASYQLEGINSTLEKSTMRIMDINDESLDLANKRAAYLKLLLSDGGEGSQDRFRRASEVLLALKEGLGRLPKAGQEVVGFLAPPLEEGRRLLSECGDLQKARDLLSDPLQTVEDLVKDLGEGAEGVTELKSWGEELKRLLNGKEGAEGGGDHPALVQELFHELRKDLESFGKIGNLALSMAEPLSFQDLVGQRIQRIIKLVKSMERRVEDLIISFGIKLQKHKEDPTRSFEDLNLDVEEYRSDLKGPQDEGEGMDQSAIDALLSSI